MFPALAIAMWLQTASPPDTEIYLASLAVRDGRVVIGAPVNITNHVGYDNQPSFTPDGSAILFTSVRGVPSPAPANSAASGSDIYRYDIASSRISQLTTTPESEYSPTVMPDGRSFSTVRVEADGVQRLWRFPLEGRDPPVLVLAEIKPVGYHVWVDARTLALYVLGQPASLQLADVASGRAEVMTSGIGRSVQRSPGGQVTFVRREAGAGAAASTLLTVASLDPQTRRISVLATAPPDATEADLAWTPDGTLLVAVGPTLYGWRAGEAAFTRVADLAALGLRGVSRLAVSPKGDRIALVGQPR